MNKKQIFAVLLSSILLSGCGLFGKEKEKIDPPKSVTYTDEEMTMDGTDTDADGTEITDNENAMTGTIQTELYLINKDGFVVPQTLALPSTESIATKALEYLVKDGPITDLLPNGFRAVLPADTKLSVDIKDKVATVNFSKEFKEYQAEEEKQILQAITWTLTQFDSIEKVKFQLNGFALSKMPVAGTPIGEAASRENGINLDTTDVGDISNTKPVTVYYLGGEEGAYYYVPVTKRISNKETNNIKAVVKELVSGPSYTAKLESDFLANVNLISDPIVEDDKVTLNFNEAVFSNSEERIISEYLLNALVLSLTEQEGIKSVAITVNGEGELVNEKGEKLAEPVTRPQKVNTGSF